MNACDSEASNEALAARMTAGHFGGFEYRRVIAKMRIEVDR